MGPTVPLPLFRVYVASISTSLSNVQLGMSMTSQRQLDADVISGQTDMSYKGELQILTKLGMRHQGYPVKTYCTVISESL